MSEPVEVKRARREAEVARKAKELEEMEAKEGLPVEFRDKGRAHARNGQLESIEGFKRLKRAAYKLLNDYTPSAAQRLIALTESDDERIAVVATNSLLDRTLGKASDQGSNEDSARRIDLTCLTAAERSDLLAALATVRRLRDLAAVRASVRGGPTIEGEAE
jgi:hypothetical protein